jgi:hypothetical protein
MPLQFKYCILVSSSSTTNHMFFDRQHVISLFGFVQIDLYKKIRQMVVQSAKTRLPPCHLTEISTHKGAAPHTHQMRFMLFCYPYLPMRRNNPTHTRPRRIHHPKKTFRFFLNTRQSETTKKLYIFMVSPARPSYLYDSVCFSMCIGSTLWEEGILPKLGEGRDCPPIWNPTMEPNYGSPL